MTKGKLPKTELRALIYLKDNEGTHYSGLYEASESTGSTKHVAEMLTKKGLAKTNDEQHYTITKRGLKFLEEQTPVNYSMEQWKYP